MRPLRRGLAIVWIGLLLSSATIARGDAQKDYEDGVAAFDRGDVIAAMELLQRAVDEGHVPAMVRLAYVLDKSESNTEAADMYRRAAEAGNAEAALALGAMYANGEGVSRDPAAALQWMTRSAESGHGPAIVTIARVYLHGELGVTASRDDAMRWLEKGVKAGYQPAVVEMEQLRRESKNSAR